MVRAGSASRTIDVVLPIKDAAVWVIQSIEALFSNCGEDFRRLIVVDDGSTPESLEIIQAKIAGNERIDLRRNLGRPGYGGACNFGTSHSDAGLIAFLNSDCLLTKGAIRKMAQLAIRDPSIGLVCPLSNNSPVLTVPMLPGSTYHQMNAALERALKDRRDDEVAIDACTVVGTCLLVTRTCWETIGEFDPVWGLGYGEETDFQFRAMKKGFRGVVAINTYVYHYGGASFGSGAAAEQLRQRNHQLFLQTWGDDYRVYAERVRRKDPIALATKALRDVGPFHCEVLFVVPGLDGAVGGHNVVCDIANGLIQSRIDAGVVVLGQVEAKEPKPGGPPMFFGPSYFFDIDSLVSGLGARPSVVVATLFSTSLPGFLLARRCGARLVNFVQGHEYLFENGRSWQGVRDSYDLPDEVLVTSEFLEGVVRQKTPEVSVTRLPVGVDTSVFFPAEPPAALRADKKRRRLCVGFVLRSAPDKGQPILLEVADQLRTSDLPIRLKVFSAGYDFATATDPVSIPVEIHPLPLPKAVIAEHLREVDIFVDASIHEGFGLFPLEAMASGAAVVCSDSGGVRDFVANGKNGFLIPEVNKPEKYVERIKHLVTSPAVLAEFKREALDTAEQLSVSACMPGFIGYFSGLLGRPADGSLARFVSLRPAFSLARVLSRSFLDTRTDTTSRKLKDQQWLRLLAVPIQHELFRPQHKFNLILLNLLERQAVVGSTAFTADWAHQSLDPLVDAGGIDLVSVRSGLERELIHFSKRQFLKAALPVISIFRVRQRRWNRWAADCVVALANHAPLPEFQTAEAASTPTVRVADWVAATLFKHQQRFNACVEGLISAIARMSPNSAEVSAPLLRAVPTPRTANIESPGALDAHVKRV